MIFVLNYFLDFFKNDFLIFVCFSTIKMIFNVFVYNFVKLIFLIYIITIKDTIKMNFKTTCLQIFKIILFYCHLILQQFFHHSHNSSHMFLIVILIDI